jgi:hypothetical protein
VNLTTESTLPVVVVLAKMTEASAVQIYGEEMELKMMMRVKKAKLQVLAEVVAVMIEGAEEALKVWLLSDTKLQESFLSNSYHSNQPIN